MCQVTPFTLPCCRRIYVSVERLPSCPEGWPKKKCPKELCVQISGYEPKDVDNRQTGICWRCIAWKKGTGPYERETTRPAFDKAFIVEGLGDVSMEDRRVKMERAGICWHCGACRDCASCGTGVEEAKGRGKGKEIENPAEAGSRKGKKRMAEADMGYEKRKVLKTEHTGRPMPTLNSTYAAPPSPMMASPGYPRRSFGEPSKEKAPQQHSQGSSSNLIAPSGQSLHPLEGEPSRERAVQQFNHASEHSRYGHPHQPVPTFDYESQHAPFQDPAFQAQPGSWPVDQSFQNQGFLGDIPVDPSLEQYQPSEELQQHSDHRLYQQQGLEIDPLSGFEVNWDHLDLNAMDDEAFERFIAHNADYNFTEPRVGSSLEFESDPSSVTTTPGPGDILLPDRSGTFQ